MKGISIFIVLMTLVLVAPVWAQDTLKSLALGQVFPAECPLPHWFPTDPLMEISLIPTDADTISGFTMDEARRYVRIYFPRTKEDLMRYEFFMYPDANLQPLTDVQLTWLTDVVLIDGASGFVTMGGGLNSPEGNVWYTWLGTTLAEILPIKLDPTMKRPNSDFSIEVTKEEPRVLSMFKPLGIEKVVGFHYTTLFEKQGTEIWAVVKPTSFYKSDTPWLVSITYGEKQGNFWAIADDIDHGWWWYMHHTHSNAYAFDVLVNIMLYARGRNLPDNIEVVHKAREEFRNFKDRRYVLISIMEFVEKFGGNVGRIEEMIDDLDQIKIDAEKAYVSQDFDLAFDLMKEAEEKNTKARIEAMKIKDQALFYVYVIEWLSVTGTLLISGSVVYSLMVRKSKFREVQLTRAR